MRNLLSVLAVAGLTVAWTATGHADLYAATFTGSQTVDLGRNSLSLAASAEFTLTTGTDTDTLTLVLTNTSTQQYLGRGEKAVPAALLTGIFFNVANNPALTYVSATASSVIQKDTSYTDVAVFSASSGTDGGWEFASNSSSNLHGLSQNYGLGTAGFDIFHGNLTGGYPSRPRGNQQFPFGIINSGYTATSHSNIKNVPLVQDEITFVFTLAHGLLTSDLASQIGDVRFQYGTNLDEPHFAGDQNIVIAAVTPEPSTLAIAAVSALGLLGYGLRRHRAK